MYLIFNLWSVAFFQSEALLKGQGHVTVNKFVICLMYIVAHMWPLCSAQIFVDGVNPQ